MKKLGACFVVMAVFIIAISGCKKNKGPAVPPPPTGSGYGLVDTGWVDSTYYFYTVTDDPEREDISYKFKWGDGAESDWTDYYPSGTSISMKHIYTTAGTYELQAKAKDIHNNETDWSISFTFKVFPKSAPPESTTITALSDSVGVSTSEVKFLVRAVDPESDSVRFFVKWTPTDSSWGKFTNVYKTFIHSGETDTIKYTFQQIGNFEVTAKASDAFGSMSLNWSNPCTVLVTMPRKPFEPSISLVSGYGSNTMYLHSPCFFRSELAQFVGSDIDLVFRFNWGDDSSGLVAKSDLYRETVGSAVVKIWNYLYHAYESAGTFNITGQMRDAWNQFSDSGAPYSITILDNFFYSWDTDVNVPSGIAITGDTIWVVDCADHEIKLFTLATGFIGTIGTSVLKAPKYIAVDSSGIYVTDASDDFSEIHKVYVFNIDGSVKTSWGGFGSGDGSEGKFNYPAGIAVDSAFVYVVDSFNKRIQKFSKSGTFVTKWQLTAEALGMKLDGNNLFVASNKMDLIYVYTTDGTYVKAIGARLGADADGYLSVPCDVAISGNNLYVIEASHKAYNNRVQKFDKTLSGTAAYLTRWGEYGSKTGQFKVAQGIATDNSGNIYVVDTGNKRIQVFKP